MLAGVKAECAKPCSGKDTRAQKYLFLEPFLAYEGLGGVGRVGQVGGAMQL